MTAVLATRQVRETRIVKFHGVIFPRSKLLHPFRFGIERSCHSSTENCTDRLGLLHLLLSFFLNSLNRNYARETRPFLPPSYFFSFSLALGWRETYKYFIRSNWITGELLVISISLSLKRNHPLSFFPPPKGEKIPGNPLILWFFNRPRAIVCVLWQRALSGPIMSVRIKGDSWEPHLVVWKGIVVAVIEGGNHCARLHYAPVHATCVTIRVVCVTLRVVQPSSTCFIFRS